LVVHGFGVGWEGARGALDVSRCLEGGLSEYVRRCV
jgi:hypothetical protein